MRHGYVLCAVLTALTKTITASVRMIFFLFKLKVQVLKGTK